MKKLLFIVLLFVAGISYGQDTLVKWTFPAFSADSVADGGIPANLNMLMSSQGGTSALDFTSLGAGGTGDTCARAIGWDAGNGVKYWQIKFTTIDYSNLTISSKQRASATGPKEFKIQYKLGYAGTWADVPGGAVLDSNNWTKGVVADLPLTSDCDNVDTVYIRWIMTSNLAVNGTTVAAAGSARIDEIFVKGSLIPGAPSMLAVTSINGGIDPFVNTGFYAVVKSLEITGGPSPVAANVDFTLTLATGSGALGGTLTGTILAGSSVDTVFGITYDVVETGVSMTATDDAAGLTAGTSALFTVQDLPPAADRVVIVDINAGIDPYVGQSFTATIETWDATSTAVNVIADVNITLSVISGTGTLGGTVTGTIVAGTNSVTITGITYDVAENSIVLMATDDDLALMDGTSSPFNVLAIPAVPAIVITEIMYNPPESNIDSLEFIEIYNNESTPVALKDFYFTGVDYTFLDETLQPGDYFIISVDSVAFINFFGVDARQWTSGSLSNSGEGLALKDGFGNLVDTVFFDDAAPWPLEPDGTGSSLVLCDPNLDNNDGANWFAATEFVDSLNAMAVNANPGTGCITTSITNHSSIQNSITCYPNPANEFLMISTKNNASLIEIFDVLGNKIFSTENTSNLITVNTADFSKGIYIVKAMINEEMHINKVSIE